METGPRILGVAELSLEEHLKGKRKEGRKKGEKKNERKRREGREK